MGIIWEQIWAMACIVLKLSKWSEWEVRVQSHWMNITILSPKFDIIAQKALHYTTRIWTFSFWSISWWIHISSTPWLLPSGGVWQLFNKEIIHILYSTDHLKVKLVKIPDTYLNSFCRIFLYLNMQLKIHPWSNSYMNKIAEKNWVYKAKNDYSNHAHFNC